MKKKLLIATILIIMGASMTGCNAQLVDTTFKFDRAVISLPNGEVVEGKVDSWRDYDNSDQIQVKIDGVTYLTHATNVVLIAE